MVVLKVNHEAELPVPVAFSWSLCWQVRKVWLISMGMVFVLLWPLPFTERFLGLLFSSLLVLMALLDYHHMLIYDELVLALLSSGGLQLLLGRMTWEEACMGAALGGGFLGALHLLVPRGMGWGDIKLAVALGCWLGVAGMLVCFYIAFISGGLCGFMIWRKRGTVKNVLVPFGPFLALGAMVAFVAGSSCEKWVEAWLCWP